MNRVFVYGTLKKGQRNNHFLHQAEFVGNFTTQNNYSMYEFEGYPAVCLHGSHVIEGEGIKHCACRIDDRTEIVCRANLDLYPKKQYPA